MHKALVVDELQPVEALDADSRPRLLRHALVLAGLRLFGSSFLRGCSSYLLEVLEVVAEQRHHQVAEFRPLRGVRDEWHVGCRRLPIVGD